MNKINLSAFDVKKYLDSRGIPYDEGGKNVKSGWLGINCLWCDDPSNHLGINLDTMGINCFRCPRKGTVITLVMKLDRLSYQSAISELKKFSYRELSISQMELENGRMRQQGQHFQSISLTQFSTDMQNYHYDYLVSRNFDPEFLRKKYDLRFTGPLDKNYRMRIIVPIYQNNQIISFTTRDITRKAKISWVHASPEIALPPKQCLYNIDTVKDTAIVVEGVADVWRLGDGTVATFGDKWTKKQVHLLKDCKRVFILFDPEEEAQKNASKMAYSLAPFVSESIILEMEGGKDPAELSTEEVEKIRLEIFGKKH